MPMALLPGPTLSTTNNLPENVSFFAVLHQRQQQQQQQQYYYYHHYYFTGIQRAVFVIIAGRWSHIIPRQSPVLYRKLCFY